MAGRRITVLLSALVVLGLCAAGLSHTLSLKTDLGFFLPRTPSPVSQLLLSRLRDGPSSGLVLIGIGGGTARERIDASDTLTRKLTESGHFAFAANGRPRIAKEDMDALLEHIYLLNPPIGADRFSADALRGSLERALQSLGTTMGPAIKRLLPRDPTLRTLEIASHWAERHTPRKMDGVWVSKDGERAIMTVVTHAAAFDFVKQQAVIDFIRTAFEAVRGSPELRLDLSGPSVFAAIARARITDEIWILTIVASVLVAALILAVFRSPLLLIVVAIPISAGLLAGTATVQAAFGYVHGITLAFGSMLIGVAIDYPIHLAIHRLDGETPETAMRRIWPTLRMGALTTVIAFVPLVVSGLTGLSQLGVFAAVGIVVAAVATRWLLPAILPEGNLRGIDGTAERLLDLAALKPWLPGVAVFAAGAAAGYFALSGVSPWEDDLRNLSPVPQANIQLDRSLRADLNAPDVRRLIVVNGETPEQVLQRLEELEPRLQAVIRDGAMKGYDAASRYIPSKRTQRDRQAALPGPEALSSSLAEAVRGLPFKPALFAPFLADIERSRTGPPLDFDRFARGRFGLRVTPLMFEQGGRWSGLVTLTDVKAPARIAQLAADPPGGAATYLDIKQESDHLMAEYRGETLRWLGLGALAALMVLAAGLRAVGAVLRVAAPVIVAVIITAAGLSAAGEALSIIHITALLLVAGLGLDYALFLNRNLESQDEIHRTSLAVMLSGLTTIIVFSVLAFSDLPVLNSMGKTVAVGVLVSILLTNGFRRKAPN